MGTQKPVVIGEAPEELGGPVAEHHGKKKPAQGRFASGGEKVKSEIKKAKVKKKETVVESPSESEIKKETEDKGEKTEEKPKKKVRQGKARIRSARYKKTSALIDHQKKYSLTEAIDLVKKTSLTRFDGNVEVHLRLLGKSGKPEQTRGLLKYPNATGKKIVVATLDDKIIEEIEKTSQAPADIYLATPEMMPKVAKLAKILGPKGKMPNPKAGTITSEPEKIKADLESGQTEYKTDSYGNIHQVIGKVSAKTEELSANFKALIAVLPAEKIKSITFCATMGPGIKVQK